MRIPIPKRFGSAAIASLALVGCTTGGGSPSAGGGDGTAVDVTLQEWAVVPAADSAPAGAVTFHITNDGPADVHEFVVLKTDLDPAALPVDADGVVTEEGEGIEVIGEVEDVPVGETEDLTVTLEAGNYILLCNIWSEDESEAHYQMGMRTPFTVDE
jgi:uncharacterized cupredoxin-like copper-binding protein